MKRKITKYIWRYKNRHNSTIVESVINLNKIKVGRLTYGNLNVFEYGKNDHNLIIGDFVSISHNVSFLLGGEHDYLNITSFPFKSIFYGEQEAISKGDIVIDSDVWIGCNATILSGVHIGQGAVIGAGSVVAKDVPPYAIYAGNKIIRYRFSEKIIQELLKIDFKELSIDFIKNNLNYFYDHINDENVEDYVKKIREGEICIK